MVEIPTYVYLNQKYKCINIKSKKKEGIKLGTFLAGALVLGLKIASVLNAEEEEEEEEGRGEKKR